MENQEHIHQFEDTVIPATCQEAGYTLHRCTCGYEYKDSYTAQIPHTFEIVAQNNPTCTEGGNQILRCSICGTEETRTCNPLGHNWSKWNVLTVPSCLEEGQQSHTCARCGITENESIKPLGHKLTKRRKSTTKKGYNDYFCANCGQMVTKKSFLRKLRNWLIGLLIAAILLVSGYFAITKIVIPNSKYNKAVSLMNDGKYEEAIEVFEELDEYKDSPQQAKKCRYQYAISLMDKQEYAKAQEIFEKLGDYENARYLYLDCRWGEGLNLLTSGQYDEAQELWNNLSAGGLFPTQFVIDGANEYLKNQAEQCLSKNKPLEALEFARMAFGNMPFEKDIYEEVYEQALTFKKYGDIQRANELFDALGDYKDAQEQMDP